MAVSGAQSQQQRSTSAADPRQLARLRGASLGALVMLIIEFALGISVNLYVTLPAGDKGSGFFAAIGKALADGPVAVGVHAAVGLLLIVAAISLLARAIASRNVRIGVLSGVGLIAILAAASSGASFVGTGQDGASLGMALATAVAMLCYAVALFLLGERT
jgi:hypothetical protein